MREELNFNGVLTKENEMSIRNNCSTEENDNFMRVLFHTDEGK
jgi:hypothetical protein